MQIFKSKITDLSTWVALIEYIAGWYSSLNRLGNCSLTLIPRWYNSSSPSLINSPPVLLPFQGEFHPINQAGILSKDCFCSLTSRTRTSNRTAKASSSLILFFVGARVPCRAYQIRRLKKLRVTNQEPSLMSIALPERNLLKYLLLIEHNFHTKIKIHICAN